jgi:Rogdi leucine zipper containing protein
LTECITLLDPHEDGSTLALSSTRSETLKGFIVRMGERITKGELLIRMTGLGSLRRGHNISIANEGIVLQQVIDTKNHIGQALKLFETPLTETNALDVSLRLS